MNVTNKDFLFIQPVFTREGVRFSPRSASVHEWLDRPEASAEDPALAALLSQLCDDGLARIENDAAALDWDAVYRLMDDPDYPQRDVDLLGLPPVVDLRPRLASKGSLADPNFTVSLAGWCRPDGSPLDTPPPLTGAVVHSEGIDGLLPAQSLAVLTELARFHARASENPDASRHGGRLTRHRSQPDV